MTDLSINFCGIKFRNPLVLASGILGITAATLKRVRSLGAGAVTTKSIWLHPHHGHKNPTMFGTEHFFINAVGLPDGGLEKAKKEIAPLIKNLADPIIVNIVGGKKQDFLDIAENILEIKPAILELNISCPNVEDEFGRPFACMAKDSADLTREVKKRVGKIPVIVKLSPGVSNIQDIAKACEQAGCDALNVGNTFGPGLSIDIETGRPILANRFGGVSGPGLKPLVIRNVYDVYRAVKIPIIGTGSVLSGADAIEIMMAGAKLVGIGSAVFYRGVKVFAEVEEEMKMFCRRHKVQRIRDIVGKVHK